MRSARPPGGCSLSSGPVAVAVAAYGLPGTRTELPTSPLATSDWQALLGVVEAERLSGLLAAAIADHALPATEEQREEAARLELEWACHALLLERTLLELSERLEAAGVRHLALKGSAFAHSVYPSPSLRSFGDVDVLVPGSRFDEAIAVVTAWGGRRRYPEPRPGFVGRFGKGAAVVLPDGIEIDVHRTFVAGPLGLRIDLGGLFATAVPITIGGRVLARLAPEEAFLHACYHTALGGRTARLVPQRDLAQMLLTTEVDLDRVHRLAAAWSGRAVVARAVTGAWASLALPDAHPLATWATGYDPTPAERRALRLYVGASRSYARQTAASVAAVPGWWAKGAYLRALLFPGREYLATREGTYRRRLRHGIDLVRHLGQGR